jgi:hypothetical protein
MDTLIQFWKSHGTRILGVATFAQSAIGIVCGISGLVPEPQMKYWLAISGVLGLLTVHRGNTNAANLAAQNEPKP